MSGANITCANCRRILWHEDEGAQAQAFLDHRCAETKRTQTLIREIRHNDRQWAEIQSRLGHPSGFTPDGAA